MSEEYVPVLCPSCTNRQALERELSARTADVERLQGLMQAVPIIEPLLQAPMSHTRSCAAWQTAHGNEVNATECTCGLSWRIRLSTEITLRSAWMKRANEAEADVERLQAEIARLREDAERWRMLPAFEEKYQLNYVGLLRDIDTARAQEK